MPLTVLTILPGLKKPSTPTDNQKFFTDSQPELGYIDRNVVFRSFFICTNPMYNLFLSFMSLT